MSAHDELRSVRIEVETASSGNDAPQIEKPEQPNRRLGALGILAALVLGVAFFVLRPAGDEAADGTVRETPPATAPGDSSPSTTGATSTTTVPDDAEEGIDQTELSLLLEAVEPGGRIEPVAIDTGDSFIDIVNIDGGFLALANVVATEEPPVFGSVDGLDWVEIEVAPFNADDPQPVQWRQLVSADDGVAAIGFVAADFGSIDGERVQFEVATSQDGFLWQSAQPSNAPRSGDGVALPITVLDSSVVSIETSNEVLLEDILRFDEVLDVNSTIAATIERCGAYSGDLEDFTISQCRDFSIVSESAIDLASGDDELDNSSPAFGRCVAQASEVTTPGFTLFGPASVSDDLQGSFAFAGTGLFPEFGQLADGRVAVVDRGALGVVSSCDAAGGLYRRDGGVVLVDFEAGQALAIRVPAELQAIFGDSTPVQFLGEFPVDDVRSHLFLVVDRDLWSIDTQNGRWTLLTPDFVASTGFGRSQFILSNSGTRLYRIDLDGLTAIDISSDDRGLLSFEVANWRISTEELLIGDARDGSFLHASDEFVFLFDGTATWRLAVPG